MPQERDPDHRRLPPPPDEPPFLESEPNPDRIRHEHPGGVPTEPRDPRPHPGRGRERAA
jgi:hypothetical protein